MYIHLYLLHTYMLHTYMYVPAYVCVHLYTHRLCENSTVESTAKNSGLKLRRSVS